MSVRGRMGKGRKAMKITRRIRIIRKDVPEVAISTSTPPPGKTSGTGGGSPCRAQEELRRITMPSAADFRGADHRFMVVCRLRSSHFSSF